MAENLNRAIQDLNLGIDDEPISLPVAVCTAAARTNQFSLIGRALMPRRQNLRAIVSSLPRNWGLTGLISGRMIEKRKFQFVFPSEELMQSIINRGPWAFNDRMLVLQRWGPEMDDLTLNYIPFWIQIRGIPLQFLDAEVIRTIGESFGEVKLVDFNPDVAAAVEFVRVQVDWNVDRPLKFQKNFQFIAGVNTLLKFRYERLKGFCAMCGMLTHDNGECLQNEEEHAQNNNDPNGEANDGMNQHHDSPPADHVALHDQQPPEEYQEGADGMNLEDHNVDEARNPEDGNEEGRRTAQIDPKGTMVERNRRDFLQALVEDIVVQSADAGDVSAANGLYTTGNGMTSLLEYGSFLELEMSDQSTPSVKRTHSQAHDDEHRRNSGTVRSLAALLETDTTSLDAGPVQKKQRVKKGHVNKYAVISTSTQPEQDALLKLRVDYNNAYASPPDWRSHFGGAVGPNPPLSP
ncbi:hypothetical protein AALP_AA6G070400 [Arabis alpina]|uniref:DUF4283 domain-containing protein n=1 Tax=Arabis alpina TaxID=50452 RepID=A0A087GML7_ARAAL|nr:hypothetical protein AALP_AA6G070400 [Arabis alpina]